MKNAKKCRYYTYPIKVVAYIIALFNLKCYIVPIFQGFELKIYVVRIFSA